MLDSIQSIQTQDHFDQAKSQILEFIQNQTFAPAFKMRLRAILNDRARSWEECLELVANLMIDPVNGRGGFPLLTYSPFGMESFVRRVLERHGFGENRIWSFAELDLTEAEITYLRDFPAKLTHGHNMPANRHLGACILMAEALYLSDVCEEGTVWPIIRKMAWHPNAKAAWFPDYDPNGLCLETHNDHLRAAIGHYGIRNALKDGGQYWVKTFTLQFGLSKLQWSRLLASNIPNFPTQEAARILFNSEDGHDRDSPSFVITWEAMRTVLMGRVSSIEAERLMEESSWIRDEWIPALIQACQTQRTTKAQRSFADVEEDDLEINILSEVELVWAGGAAFFKWVINQAVLDIECPEDCKQIELNGPCGWIGRIARKKDEIGWRRISGLGLNNDLSFQVPADSLQQNEVGVEFSNSNSGFQITTTTRLYQDGDDVSRYGADGLRHSNAWRKQLPRGEEFTLCVPVGATVGVAQLTESVMNTLGVKLLHFDQGWTDCIQISIENEVVWDSDYLLAPSKKLPPDLRSFGVNLVIDTINHGNVCGHLEVMGTEAVSVSISSDQLDLPELSKRNAISFGANGRPIAELWSGSKVRLKIQAPDGRNHWITKSWEVTMRGVDDAIPLFLGRKLDGTVLSLKSDRPVETMQQFLSMKIKMIAKAEVSGAVLLQNGFPIGSINRDAKSAPKCLSRKIPFVTETFSQNGDIISRGSLMEGVVERGIIDKIENFEKDGSSFDIDLTHEVEPTRNIQQDGRHHKILVVSQTSKDPGNRLRTTVVEGAFICMNDADWSKWKLEVGAEIGNVLGVAVCYGETLLGCWARGGHGSAQNILEAEDLTPEEVILLTDFLRWFHFPFFDRHLKDSVCAFFARHTPTILHRWETIQNLNWDGHVISQRIAEPEWDRVVRALVMETNHFLKAPMNFQGLGELVDACNTDIEKIDLIEAFISQAPASAVELQKIATSIGVGYMFLGAVSNDHPAIEVFNTRFLNSINTMDDTSKREWYWKYRNNPESCRRDFINMLSDHDAMLVSSARALQNNLDPDWSELRCEYAKLELRKGSKEPLIELWRNPSYRVNTALANGVLQTQGKRLDGAPLQQLSYLMSFPAFCRLLARKILFPNLTIPEP